MTDVDPIYRELETRLVAWARRRRDVRAIAAVGSRAQPGALRDAWSDLDLVLVVKMPRRFLATDEWIREIEEPCISYLIKTPIGEGLARGAIFRDGLATLDFAMLSRTSLLAATVLLRALSRRPSLSRLLPPPYYGQVEAFARREQRAPCGETSRGSIPRGRSSAATRERPAPLGSRCSLRMQMATAA